MIDTKKIRKLKPKNKLPMSLIRPEHRIALASVLETGAKKYGAESYVDERPEDIISALLRHLTAYQKGELIDPESGFQHVWHMHANTAILCTLMSQEAMADIRSRRPAEDGHWRQGFVCPMEVNEWNTECIHKNDQYGWVRYCYQCPTGEKYEAKK